MASKAVRQSSFLRFVYNKENTEKLIESSCQLLGLKKDEAHLFVSNLFLTSSKTQHETFNKNFERKLEILRQYLSPSQIVNNPKLVINLKPDTLSQIIKDLQSFGVTTIRIEHLSNPRLIWRLNEREWKDYDLIDDGVDCAVSYIANQNDLSDDIKQAIYDRMCQEVADYKLLPIEKLKPLITSYKFLLNSK